MSLSFRNSLPYMAVFWAALIHGCCPEMETVPDMGFDSSADRSEISFAVSDSGTKAMAERTSITAFNCLVTDANNKTIIDNIVTTNKGNLETLNGRYWPSSGTLSFFGVLPAVKMSTNNGSVSFPVGSPSFKLDGTEDFVFASRRNVANRTTPVKLTFDHILSNINNLNVSGTCSDAITTVSSITISHPKYGTYTCSADSDSWTGLGPDEETWLSTRFSSPTFPSGNNRIAGNETGTAGNGISIIPGTYTLRIRYTVTSGYISREYDKSGTVCLQEGKKNNISVSLTNDLRSLGVSVSVVDWVTGNSPTSWIEDFKPPKGFSVDLRDGEWILAANELSEDASSYDGFYRNMNTGDDKSSKTMSISFTGYESFMFKVHTDYTSSYQRGILVSELNEDLCSKLPDSNSTGVDYYWELYSCGIKLSDVLYIGANGRDNTQLDAYKTFAFNNLDPSITYTVQIIAINCGENRMGVNATLIIPINQ